MARGMKPKKKSYTVYFSSELFSLKHLIGNAYLAEAIYEKSHGKYLCVLPQNTEQRRTSPHTIRDTDLQALLECDLGLFNHDGPLLDSGTIVEFMFAKFADIPSVVLRSDFRQGGDRDNDPRNVMTSFYPRTANVVLSSIGLYKTAMHTRLSASARRNTLDEVVRLAGQHSSADAQTMCEQIAAACVRAFDRVMGTEPVMPKYLREEVYQWLALMPNFKGKPKELRRKLEDILERKVEHDLL
jgi:nucleoside 2-deoxyribosyltransferase